MRFETSVIQKIQRTQDIISIRFNMPKDFEHMPAKFMFIKLKSCGKEMEKHFTISSSPTKQDYIEVTKKHTGDEFANALAALKEGDKVTINAPVGDFKFKGEYGKIGMFSKPERICKYTSTFLWTLVQFSRRNNLEAPYV
ncbi:MAG TPA: FAD-binding oxidoreductase [Candidatus Methanoperedens sp.]